MAASSSAGGSPPPPLFSSSWTSPVPFPYHLETPSHPGPQSHPSQLSLTLQPPVRGKRTRPTHDALSAPAPGTSSLFFTPSSSSSSPGSTPSSSSAAAMSDVFSQPPALAAKQRHAAAAAGLSGQRGGSPPSSSIFSPPSASSLSPVFSNGSGSHQPAPVVRFNAARPLSPALLTRCVQQALAHHQYPTAIFYADKLCSLPASSAAPAPSPQSAAFPPLSRLLLLATALHRHGEHRRAIHLLRNRSVLCAAPILANGSGELDAVWQWIEDGGPGDDEQPDGADSLSEHNRENEQRHANQPHHKQQQQQARAPPSSSSSPASPSSRARLVLSCWHLLSLCLFQCHDYDEALLALGSDDSSLLSTLSRFQALLPPRSLLSSIAYQRAEVYAQQQHRTRALSWYLKALQFDSSCVAAFDRVVEGRMISWADEVELMRSLTFEPGMDWLELVYWNKIEQFSAKEEDDADSVVRGAEPMTDVPMTPVARRDNASKGILARLTLLTNECALVDNVELYTALVHRMYHRYDLNAALTLSSRLLAVDPYSPHLLPLHLLLLASTSNTSHLFYISHQLSTSLPSSPLASYAIALYYFTIRKYELARKFFSRSSTLDPLFLPAYLGFGHSFAAQEEGDQAMIAYRTAARLFEGSHLPLLCIGMEYLRSGAVQVAEEMLSAALRVYPHDPLTLNELGVLAYRKGDWEAAVDCFHRALQLIAVSSSSSSAAPLASAWESTCVNLGHALRKQTKYAQAIAAYQQALAPPAAANTPAGAARALGPAGGEGLGLGGGGAAAAGADGIHCAVQTALGFTYHLVGDLDPAIQYYHQALAAAPRDTLTSDLLTRALQEVADRPLHNQQAQIKRADKKDVK